MVYMPLLRLFSIMGNFACVSCGKILTDIEDPGNCPECGSSEIVEYAGAWGRWFAYIIDSVILVVIAVILYNILPFTFEETTLLLLILIWSYFAVLEASGHQATVGKMVLGIYVTDRYFQRIGYIRSYFRSFLKLILTVTPFGLLTLIQGIFISETNEKKGIHDYIINTRVLKR